MNLRTGNYITKDYWIEMRAVSLYCKQGNKTTYGCQIMKVFKNLILLKQAWFFKMHVFRA